MYRILVICSCLILKLLISTCSAQVTFPVNGVRDDRVRCYALLNANVVVSPGDTLYNTTCIIRDGYFLEISNKATIPEDAVQIDITGKWIFPSFIDLWSDYGLTNKKVQSKGVGEGVPFEGELQTQTKGAYAWNEALKCNNSAAEKFQVDSKDANQYRKSGFGLVQSHSMDGISRGASAFILLGDEIEHQMLIKEKAGHILSLKKGSSPNPYPGSLMGCIALLRQTYLDGNWYQSGGSKEERNLSLEAWNELQQLPQYFEARDVYDIFRGGKIAQEFGKSYIFKGTGTEYRRVQELRNQKVRLILPLNFPSVIDVSDPYASRQVSLTDLKHWELAPANAAICEENVLDFVITSYGLEKKSDFLKNVQLAIQHGLSPNMALKALTTAPAIFAGVDNEIGKIAKGFRANFLICNKGIFDPKGSILENWVNGKQYPIEQFNQTPLAGKYQLQYGSETIRMQAKGEAGKEIIQLLITDTTFVPVTWRMDGAHINLQFEHPTNKIYRLNGTISNTDWKGNGIDANGNWIEWSATRLDTIMNIAPKSDSIQVITRGKIIYPFSAYGWNNPPAQGKYVIKNVTIWTNTNQGILKNTDIYIADGKIQVIGKIPVNSDVTAIDGTNLHLTPGIIDEHSHIGIYAGVNECTQENTAEVRIGDVVYPDDINIYRALSGGVTTAHLLHGSCNPVGGQTQLIKLRWGAMPEAMKFEGADGFIKFALGENVKRSNFGQPNYRYPNTRMGVEQVYMNAFAEAQAYEKKKLLAQQSKLPFRKDLELETMNEILQSKRFITCHSYVQSEINMLMHVADHFKFHVNTFTHILEGYKVADKMKRHGVGASSFSDWWAYKYEVYEAIPYNGAIMHQLGITVAYNSDDPEMGRRLNQEAAKAVKYGNVSEEEALKFVTLNPAKLLHVDHRVGSIAVGKDADVVLWSDHPLRLKTKAKITWVDGRIYYDEKNDQLKRAEIATERQRIIEKMIKEKSKGAESKPYNPVEEKIYHCNSNDDEGNE